MLNWKMAFGGVAILTGACVYLTYRRLCIFNLSPQAQAIWEFKANGGEWTTYDSSICNRLEQMYTSSSPATVKFFFNGLQVEADVAGMMQKVGSPANAQPLRRLGDIAWECSIETGWCAYPASVCMDIDRALLRRMLCLLSGGTPGPDACTVPFTLLGKSLEVDLAGLLQVNTTTKWKRNLRRIGGFTWQWCDTGDVWKPYDDSFATQLERLFLNGPSFITSAETPDGVYTVDVRKMMQKRSNTGTERRVRRLGSCFWAWRDVGGWVFYDTRDALAIEAAYQSRSLNPVPLRSGRYSVSLADMKQKNLATGFEREVRRIGIKGAVMSTPLPSLAPALTPASAPALVPTMISFYPAHWDKNAMMDPVAVVAVPAGSPNFTFVKEEFEKTAKGFTIVRIELVQNKALWSKYCIGKEIMNQRAPPSARARELRLFHGTKSDVVDKINVQGFNRTFAGQNANLFGKGVYFARDAKYSSSETYSPKDAKGEKRMYFALVSVGDFCLGRIDEPVPSRSRPGAASSYDLCDSTVNDEAAPDIYVTYNDTQQYPDYLITFK
jgi:hypothetical protein